MEIEQSNFHAKCKVCGDWPTRWRVTLNPRAEYFCQRHERNKDMRVASLELEQELVLA